MPNKNFYITTSIIYTNAPPHMGFALELVQADVIARIKRRQGYNVYFLTGTDEHGLKIQKKAEKLGIPPGRLAEKNRKKVKNLLKQLDISNTDFICTTDEKRHKPAVKKIWRKLNQAGDIYKKPYKGLYCVGCEAFLTPKDLKHGKCPKHNARPEKVEEENYFFRLSRYENKLKEKIENNELKITPQGRKKEMLNLIGKGLEDVSFSRPKKNLSWGWEVPGDKTQTIYVWTEALINYISALDYGKSDTLGKMKKWWPANIHCIGKDILRFHALIWPAMLLAIGLKLPKKIFVHGFVTSKGKKMSKSIGNVVVPFEIIDKFGAQPLRYFLLKEIPPFKDGDFTQERFERVYKAELKNGLGNLVQRITALGYKNKINKLNPPTYKVRKEINQATKGVNQNLNHFQFDKALRRINKLARFANTYIDKTKPWAQTKTALQSISDSIHVVINIALLVKPFLPKTTKEIFERFGVDSRKLKLKKKGWYVKRVKVQKKQSLFPHL